jgi:hypothetical protein
LTHTTCFDSGSRPSPDAILTRRELHRLLMAWARSMNDIEERVLAYGYWREEGAKERVCASKEVRGRVRRSEA